MSPRPGVSGARRLTWFFVVLAIAAYGSQIEGRSPSLLAPTSPLPSPTQLSPASEADNPFGLMLGARGLNPEERVRLVQQLGATYFRPNSVYVQDWQGVCADCDAAQQAGLRLILTVRNNGGAGRASTPPDDLEAYSRTLGMMLDQVRPALLIVENEENSSLFFTGTPEEYGAELKAACSAAHARGIQCANGGLVSKLVALLVYQHYSDAGDTARAQSFAARTFADSDHSRLDSPRVDEQIQKGRALLQVYRDSGADYINFHWYIADPAALAEAADFLSLQTGLPVMTNEIGQHDRSPETVRQLMAAVVQLALPYAVWFSVDGPQAQGLMDPDGTLRDNGLAFQQFIGRQFD